MKYKCSLCNYETEDKSNYNKHSFSKKHIEKLNGKSPTKSQEELYYILINNENKSDYHCDFCKRTFVRFYNLIRHEKVCKIRENQKIQEEQKLKELELENKLLKNELLSTNKSKTVYNISVINFVQKNYSGAPAIENFKNYDLLDKEKLIDTLIYNHDDNKLDQYLGNIIVTAYKKDDPNKQSLWNSDCSRLKYVVKELIANNLSIWSHDPKGIKTKNYIINPLLNYIKINLMDYIKEINEILPNSSLKEIIKLGILLKSVNFIKRDIEEEILGNNIIRYIAPYFVLNKNNQ